MGFLDNMNSVVDFFPSLDFLADKPRAICVGFNTKIQNFILDVCTPPLSLTPSPSRFLTSPQSYMIINASFVEIKICSFQI